MADPQPPHERTPNTSKDHLRHPDGEVHAEGDHVSDSAAPTAASGSFEPHQESAVGKTLGDFDLVREVGRGGMGIVYAARQRSLNREVALKILPPGLGLTSEAVRRFEREAQTAAKLHHTNIVPVYAIGSEEGSYFYAMELVEGQGLDEILKELKGGQESPLMESTVTAVAGRLPERSKSASGAETSSVISESSASARAWFDTGAKLLADVADALEYAHDRGVVHRDIKPSNLLLASDGRLCVTDFGLARVAEEPGMTVTGSFLGTPAYMSPEQIAAGRITVDFRSDIYSLGAVLYEMLTFRRPFPGVTRDEVLREVMTQDPVMPRKINPRIPEDLETICMKALEKDATRRYGTAAEMANDLRQYLNRGLITAKRASPGRRIAKFVRRHPVPVTIVTAAVAIIAVTFGVTGVLSAQKASEAAARGVADARYHLSQGEYGEGLKAVNGSLGIDPNLGEARLLRARLLMKLKRAREAVDDARNLLAANPDDWQAHLVMAIAAKDSRSEVQQFQIDADEHMRAVEAQAPETADAFYMRALMTSSATEAVDLLGRAIEMAPGHAEALTERIYQYQALKNYPAARQDAERLAAIKPRSAEGRRLVGWIHALQHDRQRAFAEYEKAIRIDPNDPITYRNRAELYSETGENVKQLADLDRAVELAPDHAPSLIQRGWTRQALGKLDESEQDATRALEIDPYQPDAYTLLYFTTRAQGRPDLLQGVLERAQAAAAALQDSSGRAGLLSGISQGLLEVGNIPMAIAYCDSAILMRPNEPSYYAIRATVNRMAGNQVAMEEDCRSCADIEVDEPEKLIDRAFSLFYGCGRRDLAIRDLTRAIELAPAWSNPYDVRALMHRKDRNWDAAIADYTKAIEIAPKWGTLYNNRAVIYARLDRREEALADYRQCVELGQDSRIIRSNMAQTLVLLGRVDEGLAEYDRIAEMVPDKAYAERYRADMLLSLGRVDEALAAAEAAVAKEPTNSLSFLTRAEILALTPGGCGQALADIEQAQSLAAQMDPDLIFNFIVLHLNALHHACPDAADPRMALMMAEQGLRFDPSSSGFQSLYGAALYRNHKYGQAAGVLQQCVDGYDGIPSSGTYFMLAMSYGKSGQRAEARRYYDLGLERLNTTYPKHPIKIATQNEAAEVLGIRPPS